MFKILYLPTATYVISPFKYFNIDVNKDLTFYEREQADEVLETALFRLSILGRPYVSDILDATGFILKCQLVVVEV